MRRSSGAVVAAAVAAAAVGLSAAEARAGLDLVVVGEVRVSVGEGGSGGARLLVSPEGEVALWTQGSDGAHLVGVSGDVGGAPVVYTFEGSPVEPLAASWGPGGSVMLRGQVMGPAGVEGVSAQVGLDGVVAWEQGDRDFAAAEGYVGVYTGPAGPILWSPTRQRVLIFSAASFEVAAVSQGTTRFDFNGELRSPSVLFGTEYVGAALSDALVRPDGRFLVYYLSQNDVGARFFVYDGLETLQTWRLEGGDWTARIVRQVRFDPAGSAYLTWTTPEDPQGPGRLTKVDVEGRLQWEVDLSGAAPLADPESGAVSAVTLGEPVFMVAAAGEVALLRRAGSTLIFDARSSEDGSPLGFADLFGVTENLIFDLAAQHGAERTYLLSTARVDDPGHTHLLRLEVQLNDDPVVVEEPGLGNNGAPSMDDEDAAARPEIHGCGCEVGGASPGGLLLGLLAALGLVGVGLVREERAR